MVYLFLMMAFLGVMIPVIFIMLTNRLYKKDIVEYQSRIYGLRLDEVKIQYFINKQRFEKYPLIEKEIEHVISIVDNEYVDINRIKVIRYRIFDLKPLKENLNIIKEIDSCDDKFVKKIYTNIKEISTEIAHIRSPFICYLNIVCESIQIFGLFFVFKIFKFINSNKKGKSNKNIPTNRQMNLLKKDQKLRYS